MAGNKFYRLRIFVGGSACLISHNDQIKVLQRTLIRAQVPVSYTRGFNPRPLLSFGPARPTGFSSLAEMVDVCIKEEYQPEDLKQRINRSFPEGFSVISVSRIDESEFGRINEKVISAKAGAFLSVDVEPEFILEKLNQAVREAGIFILSERENARFFEILEKACTDAKISMRKEGLLAVFNSESKTKTAPRIDRLLADIDVPAVKKSVKGLYIVDYEFKE